MKKSSIIMGGNRPLSLMITVATSLTHFLTRLVCVCVCVSV
jgi:hypothetical protein